MSTGDLSLVIEKFIDTINIEESEYIRTSDLKKLSSTQIHYLDLIYHEDNLPLSTLARKLKVTKPSVSNHIDKLEKLGYVRKVKSDEDKRVQYLHLTAKGKTMAKLHDRFHDVFAQKLSGKLSEDELKLLIGILRKAVE